MGGMVILLLSLAILVGIIHAVYVYREKSVLPPSNHHDNVIRRNLYASYYALWALALWIVLGSYVAGLWLLAIVPYVLVKLIGKTLSTPEVESVR